jgi:hypothetical protein
LPDKEGCNVALKWWQWRNIHEKLRLFGRALQGPEPYRIEFADEPGLTGLTDFDRRLIKVNPDMVPGLKPRRGYDITKAVLCHEAGHCRFTTPTRLPPVVHMVSNILEDQRIESLMMEEFAGTRPLIRALTEELYRRSPELDGTDDPGQVVAAALQYRWAYRLGLPLKGELSATNQDLWAKVRPQVQTAWVAPSSLEVDRIAQRIVKFLGLREHQVPAWVVGELDRCEGARRPGDPSETRAPAPPAPFSAGDGSEAKPEPFDGELLPDDHKAGHGSSRIEPKPYLELEERAAPLAKELIEELSPELAPEEPEPAEQGGRLSVRQYLRDRERPFLVREDESRLPPTLALRVVVDHSTSMNFSRAGRVRIESVAEGAMMLHLACTALGIDHQVAVTPQQTVLAELRSGERGKALIAGMVPAQTGWEDIAVAVKRHGEELMQAGADIRLVFVLHDGYPNDGPDAKKLCQSLRGKVEVIGVLLDPDEGTQHAMGEIFGQDRLVACQSAQLPRKLAAMLRSIRGV